jgi:hypothetical protein
VRGCRKCRRPLHKLGFLGMGRRLGEYRTGWKPLGELGRGSIKRVEDPQVNWDEGM